MNLQIVSNAQNKVGGINYTNEFVMPLPTLLDAENKELFIRVLNISYPLTIENVLKEKCGIRVKLSFPTDSNSGIEIKFKTDMMYLPAGYYTLEKLITTLNAFVSEYGIIFSVLNSGRIGVTYSLEREYWYSSVVTQIKTSAAPVQIYEKYPVYSNSGDELELEFTENLKYILGLRELIVHPSVAEDRKQYDRYALTYTTRTKEELDAISWHHYMNKVYAEDFLTNASYDYVTGTSGGKLNNFALSFMGAALPDISDGVDKMFIYCDQVELSIVGDTYASLLAIVPLKGKDRGNGSLCVYTPPDIRRKLIKCRINEFKVGIYDTTHTLIPFSSGTVNIECVIE